MPEAKGNDDTTNESRACGRLFVSFVIRAVLRASMFCHDVAPDKNLCISGFLSTSQSKDLCTSWLVRCAACFRAITTKSIEFGRIERFSLNHTRTCLRIRFLTTALPTARLVLKPKRGSLVVRARGLDCAVISKTKSGLALRFP